MWNPTSRHVQISQKKSEKRDDNILLYASEGHAGISRLFPSCSSTYIALVTTIKDGL